MRCGRPVGATGQQICDQRFQARTVTCWGGHTCSGNAAAVTVPQPQRYRCIRCSVTTNPDRRQIEGLPDACARRPPRLPVRRRSRGSAVEHAPRPRQPRPPVQDACPGCQAACPAGVRHADAAALASSRIPPRMAAPMSSAGSAPAVLKLLHLRRHCSIRASCPVSWNDSASIGPRAACNSAACRSRRQDLVMTSLVQIAAAANTVMR